MIHQHYACQESIGLQNAPSKVTFKEIIRVRKYIQKETPDQTERGPGAMACTGDRAPPHCHPNTRASGAASGETRHRVTRQTRARHPQPRLRSLNYTSGGMAGMKKTENDKCCQGCRENGSLHTAGRNENWWNHFRKQPGSSSVRPMQNQHETHSSTSRGPDKRLHVNVHGGSVHESPGDERSRRSSTDEGESEKWYILSHEKEQSTDLRCTAGESRTQGKRTNVDTKGQVSYDPLCKISRTGKLTETESW